MTLTAKDVAEITRLLEESSFDELYLELDGMKLSLRRGESGGEGSNAASPQPRPGPAVSGSDRNVHDVPAPLLGTFYRAPKPGAPPFIEIGAQVQEETIVGIIEVMKLMNAVRAGVCGRVTEILARDGELVEYGETLLRVGKTG